MSSRLTCFRDLAGGATPCSVCAPRHTTPWHTTQPTTIPTCCHRHHLHHHHAHRRPRCPPLLLTPPDAVEAALDTLQRRVLAAGAAGSGTGPGRPGGGGSSANTPGALSDAAQAAAKVAMACPRLLTLPAAQVCGPASDDAPAGRRGLPLHTALHFYNSPPVTVRYCCALRSAHGTFGVQGGGH